MGEIERINQVIVNYFNNNSSTTEIRAKDLMDKFIEAGIFEKDHRNGLPIRKILRELDKKNELNKIPSVYADRKIKNTNWYFRRKKL